MLINNFMNYQKHYDLLIERAKQRNIKGYTEKHHIVPRCLGGADHTDNLVKLTAEEHYIAHQLLVKIYPTNRSLLHAAIMMIPESSKHERNNKLYGWLRKRFSEQRKKDAAGENNPTFGQKWFHCPETLHAVRTYPGSEPNGYVLGRAPQHRKRYCKSCGVFIDVVSVKNGKDKFCKSCRAEHKKNYDYKHDYKLIKQIYKEHIDTGTGYYTLAQRHGINKWSIYDYIGRYKDRLDKDFGV